MKQMQFVKHFFSTHPRWSACAQEYEPDFKQPCWSLRMLWKILAHSSPCSPTTSGNAVRDCCSTLTSALVPSCGRRENINSTLATGAGHVRSTGLSTLKQMLKERHGVIALLICAYSSCHELVVLPGVRKGLGGPAITES